MKKQINNGYNDISKRYKMNNNIYALYPTGIMESQFITTKQNRTEKKMHKLIRISIKNLNSIITKL